MSPRITSMENLIASDPGDRNIFGLVIGDQLRLAAQSLRLARRVGIVSGFFIPAAGAGETDGPPGALAVGRALETLGIPVDYITDLRNAKLFQALGLKPLLADQAGGAVHDALARYLTDADPTHLISIERCGRGRDGRYRNMHGEDISATTAALDELFLIAARRGINTIGIGDGGNEIGMGKVFADALATIPQGKEIASTVPADFCIAAGVSNWGAYGLVGALSVLSGRDLLPSPAECVDAVERLVRDGGAVDGRTHRREPTVNGLPLAASLRMLEEIRRLIMPSPLEHGGPLHVGIIGYGETGRAAARLLLSRGHRVRISDQNRAREEAEPHSLPRGGEGDQGGSLNGGSALGCDLGTPAVEAFECGRHSIEFLSTCDMVVVSPGVSPDSPIVGDLHRAGIPVMSELEMASQLCDRPLIAVTGTIGKRSTIELMQKVFAAAGRSLEIGGNKGLPLSAILANAAADQNRDRKVEIDNLQSPIANPPIALAVSSFQLETVVHFRPHIAVLLNINEAHLDRHRSTAEYIRTKSRVFMNHHPDDVLILPYDDERLRSLARKHHGRTFFISQRQEVERGAWLAGGRIRINVDGRVEDARRAEFNAHPFADQVLVSRLIERLTLPTNW